MEISKYIKFTNKSKSKKCYSLNDELARWLDTKANNLSSVTRTTLQGQDEFLLAVL